MEEYELVDENGNCAGLVLNEQQIKEFDNYSQSKKQYIYVVGIVILNKDNQVLFQKRSRHKKSNPLKWGICGGKVNKGETAIDAAIRETYEEIGIMLEAENLVTIRRQAVDSYYFEVVYTYLDIDIKKCKISLEEVEELQYFDINVIEELDTEGTEWLEPLREKLNI